MLLFRPWYQQSLPGRWVGYWDLYCREIQEGFSLPPPPPKAFESPLGTPNVQLLLKHTLQSQSRAASSAIYGFDHSDGLLLQAITLPSPCQVIFLGSSESFLKRLVKQHFYSQKTCQLHQTGTPLEMLWETETFVPPAQHVGFLPDLSRGSRHI